MDFIRGGRDRRDNDGSCPKSHPEVHPFAWGRVGACVEIGGSSEFYGDFRELPVKEGQTAQLYFVGFEAGKT